MDVLPIINKNPPWQFGGFSDFLRTCVSLQVIFNQHRLYSKAYLIRQYILSLILQHIPVVLKDEALINYFLNNYLIGMWERAALCCLVCRVVIEFHFGSKGLHSVWECGDTRSRLGAHSGSKSTFSSRSWSNQTC